ncbi:hypothetical protein CSUB01_03419 [Colletotrichum sublineola]|uniref:Uncharacterized protein n=1 Tax=Colletotrichum sublineola TaxID=1173701 RepID=A0A066XRY6_COLSU|nr:hypothetical protein CSUB01_03419 [Colletotrichum sublineola]
MHPTVPPRRNTRSESNSLNSTPQLQHPPPRVLPQPACTRSGMDEMRPNADPTLRRGGPIHLADDRLFGIRLARGWGRAA